MTPPLTLMERAKLEERLDLLQVLLLAGREIIQPDNRLVQPEQGLEQVRANEARDPGHQPGFGCSTQS